MTSETGTADVSVLNVAFFFYLTWNLTKNCNKKEGFNVLSSWTINNEATILNIFDKSRSNAAPFFLIYMDYFM